MSVGRHLHLDEVVTSFPELGPTVPDGGYSWIVLSGILLIQMTVPSVLSMYGIVLGYLCRNARDDYDVFDEKIILTPMLFAAFWSLADPWSRTIVTMASVPRLVGIIGVALLSTGIIASGYLATGGVGAYLASSSAGAVMGIGASFVILQSDCVLRKYFRRRLLLALTLKNIGASLGLLLIPGLMYILLSETGVKAGLLLMTIVFVPTCLGTLTLRSPSPQQASPYRLLLSAEEDNELPIRMSPELTKSQHREDDVLYHFGYGESDERSDSQALFNDGNHAYSYQEPDEDVDLFVSPVVQSNGKWKQQVRVLKSFRFWAATVGWVGMKTSALFFWILLPVVYLTNTPSTYSSDWVFLPIAAGFGTLLPSIFSYKILRISSQYRRIYFGSACWMGAITLMSLTCVTNYAWFLTYAFLGGISIGSLSSCQDLALFDVMGTEAARRSYKGFSTLVGLFVLTFCFVHSVELCLRLVALVQFIGGLYWASSPVVELIKARRHELSHSTGRTNNRDET